MTPVPHHGSSTRGQFSRSRFGERLRVDRCYACGELTRKVCPECDAPTCPDHETEGLCDDCQPRQPTTGNGFTRNHPWFTTNNDTGHASGRSKA